MANVLLNYCFQFTENKGTQPPDYSFLHCVAVVVKPNSHAHSSRPYAIDIYDEETLKKHTDNTSVLQLINGGLSSIRLLVSESLGAIDSLLDDTEFYTLGISKDFPEEESSEFVPTTFSGVVYSIASNKSKALKLLSDNISKLTKAKSAYKERAAIAQRDRSDTAIQQLKASAEELATMHRRCAFFDVHYNDEGAHYAFGKLLSSTYWRDQQYIQARNPSWASATKLGEADDLFNKRISFYLSDSKYGTRLAFFGAGGQSITEAYVDRYIQLDIQGTGLNYISANFPRKTASSLIKIEDRLQDVIDKYTAQPFEYLDASRDNKIQLFDVGEMYYLSGLLDMQVAQPIWRIKVEVTQE